MNIDHLAIWCNDLEVVREFYIKYFDCTSNAKYTNESKGFSSYFLTFSGGSRIELMHREDIASQIQNKNANVGIAHFAINVGSEEAVNSLTARLRTDNIRIISNPRHTGDGYYESGIQDIEGNYVELTT